MAVYLKVYLYTILNLKIVLINLFFDELLLPYRNKDSTLI